MPMEFLSLLGGRSFVEHRTGTQENFLLVMFAHFFHPESTSAFFFYLEVCCFFSTFLMRYNMYMVRKQNHYPDLHHYSLI